MKVARGNRVNHACLSWSNTHRMSITRRDVFFEIVVFLVLLGQMALVYDAWREITFWRKVDEICTLRQYEALPFVLLASAVASLLIYVLHFHSADTRADVRPPAHSILGRCVQLHLRRFLRVRPHWWPFAPRSSTPLVEDHPARRARASRGTALLSTAAAASAAATVSAPSGSPRRARCRKRLSLSI
jgi:hypothetical protein